jgi:hypothetical protein
MQHGGSLITKGQRTRTGDESAHMIQGRDFNEARMRRRRGVAAATMTKTRCVPDDGKCGEEIE